MVYTYPTVARKYKNGIGTGTVQSMVDKLLLKSSAITLLPLLLLRNYWPCFKQDILKNYNNILQFNNI
jgi:hypothetical protein